MKGSREMLLAFTELLTCIWAIIDGMQTFHFERGSLRMCFEQRKVVGFSAKRCAGIGRAGKGIIIQWLLMERTCSALSLSLSFSFANVDVD